jgi:uncharacterized membrane protein
VGGIVTLHRTPRHLGFYVAVAAGALAALVAGLIAPALILLCGINAFFLAYLAVAASQLFRTTPAFLRKHADEEDAPAPVILIVMGAAVIVSTVSLFGVLRQPENAGSLELGLSVASVALGWFAIHTMWTMHYAYEYYRPGTAAARRKDKGVSGGLEFPGGEDPDGTAFLYFSYVVGMTAQTSDTTVTSNTMRRIVVVHSVFSFFFNTIIVAAAVNVVIALAH